MRATPFLMFQGEADEALAFYVSVFDDARIEDIRRYGPDGPGREGTVMQALFRLGGLRVKCIDSPVRHAFGFTPSFSFFIDCGSEAEIRRLAEVLAEGGEVLMPLGDHGFSRRFAWLNDRFGVSWQLNLA